MLIETARNGQEAVDKVKNQEFDIILMDLQMPVMDGFTASEIIRKTGVNIPIIALSAAVMPEDMKKTMKVGMNDHISKPINQNKLIGVLIKWVTSHIE